VNKFETLKSVAAPIPQKNVDTDYIIRIERCTGTPKQGSSKPTDPRIVIP
jgi:3-isopropylmalate dehydratase small subunit